MSICHRYSPKKPKRERKEGRKERKKEKKGKEGRKRERNIVATLSRNLVSQVNHGIHLEARIHNSSHVDQSQ